MEHLQQQPAKESTTLALGYSQAPFLPKNSSPKSNILDISPNQLELTEDGKDLYLF